MKDKELEAFIKQESNRLVWLEWGDVTTRKDEESKSIIAIAKGASMAGIRQGAEFERDRMKKKLHRAESELFHAEQCLVMQKVLVAHEAYLRCVEELGRFVDATQYLRDSKVKARIIG